MNFLFRSSFYHIFTPSNSEEFIDILNKKIEEKNTEKLSWAKNCIVNTIPLDLKEVIPFIIPSLDEFSKHFSYKGNVEVMDPWINLYPYNGFQEVHTHPDCDIVCIFFLNSGHDFGKLYFYDRLSGIMNSKVQELVGYADVICPNFKKGDCIMFPSHLFHGVTPHKSKEVRKTFAFNFKLT